MQRAEGRSRRRRTRAPCRRPGAEAPATPRRRTTSSWEYVATLSGDTGDEDFGSYVTISGGTVVVGGDEAAYVFERDRGGPGAWGRVTKLTPSRPQDFPGFGGDVELDRDTLAIGTWLATESPGAVLVFDREAGGSWNETASVRSPTGQANDGFG